jgi:hypothetical protein
MFQSPKKGVLLLSSGKQIDNKTLARICGVDELTINKLLTELEDAGVFSRLDNQAIYNRRMYREGKISEARSRAGSWERKQQNFNKIETKVKQNAETETKTKTINEDKDCKEEEVKEKILTPIQMIVEEFKRVRGYDTIPGWDKANFARFSKNAKAILDMSGGDVEMAIACIQPIGEYCEKQEWMDWHLGTVQKKFADWKSGRLKVIDSTKHKKPDWTAFKSAKIALERKGGYDAIVAQLRELPESVWGELKEWYTHYYHDSSAARSFSRAQDTVYAEREATKHELTKMIARIGVDQ